MSANRKPWSIARAPFAAAAVAALSLTGLLAFATAHAQVETPADGATPPEPELLRVNRDDAGMPLALQTPILQMRPSRGSDLPADLEVDLVGAIHIADIRYFDELNARFRDYDTVLYELVAPEGTRVPLGGVEGGGILSSIQGGLGGLLGLSFQLNHIDYTQPNLIHSDLSPEEISASMAARGESAASLIARLLSISLSEYSKDPVGASSLGLIAAFFSPDRERMLKAQLAPMLLDMETATAAFEGEDGSTLVGERNKRAVSDLGERIASGDRRIAIFYGAAHLGGIEELIEQDFGMQRAGIVWVDAWDLR